MDHAVAMCRLRCTARSGTTADFDKYVDMRRGGAESPGIRTDDPATFNPSNVESPGRDTPEVHGRPAQRVT